MKIKCEGCGAVVATDDRRRRIENRVKASQGLEIELRRNQAPRIKCRCGHVTVLVSGWTPSGEGFWPC